MAVVKARWERRWASAGRWAREYVFAEVRRSVAEARVKVQVEVRLKYWRRVTQAKVAAASAKEGDGDEDHSSVEVMIGARKESRVRSGMESAREAKWHAGAMVTGSGREMPPAVAGSWSWREVEVVGGGEVSHSRGIRRMSARVVRMMARSATAKGAPSGLCGARGRGRLIDIDGGR